MPGRSLLRQRPRGASSSLHVLLCLSTLGWLATRPGVVSIPIDSAMPSSTTVLAADVDSLTHAVEIVFPTTPSTLALPDASTGEEQEPNVRPLTTIAQWIVRDPVPTAASDVPPAAPSAATPLWSFPSSSVDSSLSGAYPSPWTTPAPAAPTAVLIPLPPQVCAISSADTCSLSSAASSCRGADIAVCILDTWQVSQCPEGTLCASIGSDAAIQCVDPTQYEGQFCGTLPAAVLAPTPMPTVSTSRTRRSRTLPSTPTPGLTMSMVNGTPIAVPETTIAAEPSDVAVSPDPAAATTTTDAGAGPDGTGAGDTTPGGVDAGVSTPAAEPGSAATSTRLPLGPVTSVSMPTTVTVPFGSNPSFVTVTASPSLPGNDAAPAVSTTVTLAPPGDSEDEGDLDDEDEDEDEDEDPTSGTATVPLVRPTATATATATPLVKIYYNLFYTFQNLYVINITVTNPADPMLKSPWSLSWNVPRTQRALLAKPKAGVMLTQTDATDGSDSAVVQIVVGQDVGPTVFVEFAAAAGSNIRFVPLQGRFTNGVNAILGTYTLPVQARAIQPATASRPSWSPPSSMDPLTALPTTSTSTTLSAVAQTTPLALLEDAAAAALATLLEPTPATTVLGVVPNYGNASLTIAGMVDTSIQQQAETPPKPMTSFGIGIGAGVGVLLVVASGGYTTVSQQRKRKRKHRERRSTVPHTADPSGLPSPHPHLEGEGAAPPGRRLGHPFARIRRSLAWGHHIVAGVTGVLGGRRTAIGSLLGAGGAADCSNASDVGFEAADAFWARPPMLALASHVATGPAASSADGAIVADDSAPPALPPARVFDGAGAGGSARAAVRYREDMFPDADFDENDDDDDDDEASAGLVGDGAFRGAHAASAIRVVAPPPSADVERYAKRLRLARSAAAAATSMPATAGVAGHALTENDGDDAPLRVTPMEMAWGRYVAKKGRKVHRRHRQAKRFCPDLSFIEEVQEAQASDFSEGPGERRASRHGRPPVLGPMGGSPSSSLRSLAVLPELADDGLPTGPAPMLTRRDSSQAAMSANDADTSAAGADVAVSSSSHARVPDPI
ncbi:hypothetical protein CXG81DRAFT_20584 [Caulochytrium protostelioides]|uniref:Uncharacterized protein n=1 Tax=Caulochytrium protostelioides TaxID=1555241 RepID=A0A4P9X0M7_9FUNG|nr:hypothetical protein CXG81DRAFT_20584 [Caulochytrium protostelioides]|eukprot:RKO99311.1 hypothetical protein CXG81DRAFT_20584 [Caulochytrium protostelioides]